MQTLRLEFTPQEARRLERAAVKSDAGSLSELAKRAILQYLAFDERQNQGHFPPPAPSAHRRPSER